MQANGVVRDPETAQERLVDPPLYTRLRPTSGSV